jgi:hypothetical protein
MSKYKIVFPFRENVFQKIVRFFSLVGKNSDLLISAEIYLSVIVFVKTNSCKV